MISVLLKSIITILGAILGSKLSTELSRTLFTKMFPSLSESEIFMNMLNSAIVFCVAALFYLAASVLSKQMRRLDDNTENYFKRIPAPKLATLIIGVLLGLMLSSLVYPVVRAFSPKSNLGGAVFLFISYSVITAIMIKLSFFAFFDFLTRISSYNGGTNTIAEIDKSSCFSAVLDTSAMIDGRVLALLDMGLLRGKLIVPDFVLDELQNVADSQDDVRRQKGRRGLDILEKIRVKSKPDAVHISETEYDDSISVDKRLLLLCEDTGSTLISVDFNLCKVASIQEVSTINLNELAANMRPDFLPGEIINTKPIRNGKSKGQALAYLDDGTMIVIEEADHLIGEDLEVEVTGSLQTPAGKMIFAKRTK